MKNPDIIRSEISSTLQTALLGEIYPAIRQIVFKYNPEQEMILLRYYMDREPTEDDYENVSTVMTEVIAAFSAFQFKEVKEECIYSNLPGNKLPPLDRIVYSRREYYPHTDASIFTCAPLM